MTALMVVGVTVLINFVIGMFMVRRAPAREPLMVDREGGTMAFSVDGKQVKIRVATPNGSEVCCMWLDAGRADEMARILIEHAGMAYGAGR